MKIIFDNKEQAKRFAAALGESNYTNACPAIFGFKENEAHCGKGTCTGCWESAFVNQCEVSECIC